MSGGQALAVRCRMFIAILPFEKNVEAISGDRVIEAGQIKPNFNALERLRNAKRFTFGSLNWIVTLQRDEPEAGLAHDRIVARSEGHVPASRATAPPPSKTATAHLAPRRKDAFAIGAVMVAPSDKPADLAGRCLRMSVLLG
jgi:hypothetical protein